MLSLAIERLHREFIEVDESGRSFRGGRTGCRFTPLGFNYDHDEEFRLLESYWHQEWSRVERDLSSIRQLGANVVRIHLQLEKFVLGPGQANEKELQQLDKLITLASSLGLYLDIVGLCCYHPWEVPEWYNNMNTEERWEVQAFFWSTLARRYSEEPGIFCFDLMNEPVVPARRRPRGSWLGNEYAGKTYIQFITLDGTQKPRYEVAHEWLQTMKAAIRQHDSHHMITVGLVDWSLPDQPVKSGFFPKKIADDVDFISAHLYPQEGKPEEMLKILEGFCVGLPVVIDETFHLKCNVDEHLWFLSEASKKAQGFMSFYTEFLPEKYDDGRNRIISEARYIFKKSAPLFK